MGHCDNFSTDVVIQSVGAVCVDEAITHPKPRFNTFLHFRQHFERRLKGIITTMKSKYLVCILIKCL